jgi:hypothetical protein
LIIFVDVIVDYFCGWEGNAIHEGRSLLGGQQHWGLRLLIISPFGRAMPAASCRGGGLWIVCPIIT